jgi:hypothetical protein
MILISTELLFALLLRVHSFLILILPILLGIISEGGLPLFNRRGVQMTIGVYKFLSNDKKSSVNVFITTINSSVAGAGCDRCKIFKFNFQTPINI